MVAVAILAAGKGTRMRSDLPKVLHSLGGKTLLERVLETAQILKPDRQLVIIGHRADLVRESLQGQTQLEFVEQTQQLGTGHAAQQLLPTLADYDGDVLILNGDAPLLRPETLQNLLETHRSKGNAATILTALLPEPKGYGRVFCDQHYQFQSIIEDRDCTPEQRLTSRVNAGIYCFRWRDLAQALPQLTTENDQKEYYLTDAVNLVSPVSVQDVADYQEILGINDRVQMAQAYGILQARQRDYWMRQGVTIIDPSSVTIEDTVVLAPNVTIEPQTHLRGNTRVETGARLGPGSLIENSHIGANVTVMFSVVLDSQVKADSRVGPYAHLRSGAMVGEQCRIGNFVELKNSTLGDRTNAAHLSYLGDATLGTQVNIGAGTITVNYDGVNKHPTVIGDRCKIGSHSTLVAPIVIGNDVTTAAGSAITEDLPDDCLAIARSRQVVKPGWRLRETKAQE